MSDPDESELSESDTDLRAADARCRDPDDVCFELDAVFRDPDRPLRDPDPPRCSVYGIWLSSELCGMLPGSNRTLRDVRPRLPRAEDGTLRGPAREPELLREDAAEAGGFVLEEDDGFEEE